MPVLFAVDDWNALYWVTTYNEWDGMRKRNLLPTGAPGSCRLPATLAGLYKCLQLAH